MPVPVATRGTHVTQESGTPTTIPLSVTVTQEEVDSDECLVFVDVCAGENGTGPTSFTVTTSPVETVTTVAEYFWQSTRDQGIGAYYFKPQTAGTYNITVTFDIGCEVSMAVAAVVTGCNTADPIDTSVANFNAANPHTVNQTPTVADTLNIYHRCNGNTGTFTLNGPSGATEEIDEAAENTKFIYHIIAEYESNSTATHQWSTTASVASVGGPYLYYGIKPAPTPHVDEDGSSWPTSGAASINTMNIEDGSFISLSAEHTDNTPPSWSSAAGTVQCLADNSCLIRLGTRRFENGETDHIERISFKANRTGTPEGSNGNVFVMDVGGTQQALDIFCYDGNGRGHGYMFYWDNHVGTEQQFISIDVESANGHAFLEYGEWYELTIVYHQAAGTSGFAQFFINDVLVGEVQSLDTSSADYGSDSNWTFRFPAITGLQWEIAAPFQTEGDISSVDRDPRWSAQPANWDMQKFLVPGWDSVSSSTWGQHLQPSTWTNVSLADYGSPLNRRRYTIGGTSSVTVKSQYNLGSLSYNEDGWATVAWLDCMRNSTESMVFTIRDSSDSSDIVSLTLNAGDVLLEGLTSRLTSLPVGYFALTVQLRNTGQAQVAFYSLTNDFGAGGQQIWSADLDDWTPQELGPIQVEVTPVSGTPEVGSVGVYKWFHGAIVDSLTNTPQTGLSYNLARWNNVTAELPKQWECEGVPNARVQFRSNWEAVGKAPLFCPLILGRSGRNLGGFITSSGYEDLPHGLHIHVIDAASINNLVAINAGDPQTTVDTLETNLRLFLNSVSNKQIRVTLSTPVDRPSGASWDSNGFTDQEREGSSLWRNKVVALAEEFSTFYAGVHTKFALDQSSNPDSLYTVSDYIHFGDDTAWMQAFVDSFEAPQTKLSKGSGWAAMNYFGLTGPPGGF